MVKFLVGLVFGVAFCGAVLAALAVMNPLERDGRPAAPAETRAPDEAESRVQPAAGAAPVSEPAPQQMAEPDSGGTAQPEDEAAAMPEAQPAPESAPETATAAALQAAPEPAPQPESQPDVAMASESAPAEAMPAAQDTPPAAPDTALAAEDTAAPAPQVGDEAVVASSGGPEAPQATGDMASMPAGGSGAPVPGDAGPMALTGGPEFDGMSLGSPAVGGDSATVSATVSDRPVRMAAAPQQVTADGVDTGARPSVNTESAAMPEIGGSELEEEDLPLGPAPDLQAGAALADNAAGFSGDSSRPLMSIILIDTGENPDLRAGLTALTAPITFGVEADIRDAEEVATGYRNAGFEVTAVLPASGRLGLVPDLPEEEVEPLLARVFQRVPVAATVMDPIGGPLPKDRRIANAVLEALSVTGHGLLTHRGNGLNNVPIIASEQGVPSELVYRVIDEESGQANINLALERAVLDASRSGHVIVVGRVRQETVTTLFSWLLGSGAREVTIAPASAVLRSTES